jgi:surfeit locus 1 family protein
MPRTFQPRTGPSIIASCMLAVLLGLGVWQLERLAWKTDLLKSIHDRMAQKPVPLPEKIADPAAWEYRRVKMAGQYVSDREFLIQPRTLDGKAGYHMYVPFRRVSGGIVFVNRGWISDDLLGKAIRPRGMVAVEGIVQLPHKSAFTPDNNPEKGEWYWPDVEAMAAAAHVKNPAPVIVTVAARRPGVYPAGGQVRLDIPNDHKQYAIFWFTMAFVLIGIWAMSSMTEVKKK